MDRRKSVRGISPVIATVILVAIAIVIALAVAGPLHRMAKVTEVSIRYQDSYIYIMGKEAHLVLSITNNDGALTIDWIAVEQDSGNPINVSDASKIHPVKIASHSDVSVMVDLGSDATFGAKDMYKVVVHYTRPDGSPGTVVENIIFKG